VTLTVLTFNVLQLQFKGSRHRARAALRVIERADPDVIVLNEAFNRQSRALVAQLQAEGYAASPYLGGFGGAWRGVSGRRRGIGGFIGGGVYVLSRLPIEEQYQHVYRSLRRTTTEALSNKGCLLVKLRPDGEPLWVAGTHLHADERGNCHSVRMAQLGELRAFVAATVPVGEPVVLAGDLNIEYYDADGRPGTDRAEADRAVGGNIAPQEVIHDFTFDGTLNALTHKDTPNYRNVLDYVGVLQSRGHTMSIGTTTLGFEPGREASDHFPVLATVTVPSPEPPGRS